MRKKGLFDNLHTVTIVSYVLISKYFIIFHEVFCSNFRRTFFFTKSLTTRCRLLLNHLIKYYFLRVDQVFLLFFLPACPLYVSEQAIEPFTQIYSYKIHIILTKYFSFPPLLPIFCFSFFINSLFLHSRVVPNHFALLHFLRIS